MRIQVTGLPGSGKSLGIDLFKSQTLVVPRVLDIATLTGTNRERLFRKLLLKVKEDVIAESACGLWIPRTYIVRLDRPLQQIYESLAIRDGSYDPDYLSLLQQFMVRPDITVTSSDDLADLLQRLF